MRGITRRGGGGGICAWLGRGLRRVWMLRRNGSECFVRSRNIEVESDLRCSGTP